MENIAIPKNEYLELRRKADAYDRMNAGSSNGGKKSSAALTPEQRRERAKTACRSHREIWPRRGGKDCFCAPVTSAKPPAVIVP